MVPEGRGFGRGRTLLVSRPIFHGYGVDVSLFLIFGVSALERGSSNVSRAFSACSSSFDPLVPARHFL